jgi:hypothetical protein
MNLFESLKHNIAATLSGIKAYDLPAVCEDLGLSPGDSTEAFSSKYKYVFRRIQHLGKNAAVTLGKQVLQAHSSYQLEETLDLLEPLAGTISAITRRNIIDALSAQGNL